MTKSNLIKRTIFITVIFFCVTFFSVNSLYADNYTQIQISWYESAVKHYQKNEYISASYTFGLFYGSVFKGYNENYANIPKNIQLKLQEVNTAINYCIEELKRSEGISKYMESIGSNATVSYQIETTGKMDGDTKYETRHVNINFPRSNPNKPHISNHL
jgi:hypothetical protein